MNVAHPTIHESAGSTSATEEMKQFVSEMYKRRWVVVSFVLASLLISFVYLSRQPKEYSALTVVEYDPTPPRPLGSAVESMDDPVEAFWLSQEFYETQNRILMSVNVAERTVRRLGLNRDLRFVYGPRPPAGSRPVTVAQAARILRGRASVDLVRGTRLANIHVDDTDPRRAARIANALVASYVEKTMEDRTVQTIGALDWLHEQLGTVRGQLENSELALHEFKQDNNILSVSLEDRQNMITNQLEGLTEALTATRRERIEMGARVAALRSASDEDPLEIHAAAIDDSEAVQTLRNRYRVRAAECTSLGTRYGNEHPEMVACRSELDTIKESVRREVRGILSTAESSLREIQEVEGGVRGALDEVNRAGLELNLREIEYQRLLRERETNSHLFGVLLDRSAATNVTRFHRVTFARVVDEATAPTAPSRPRKLFGTAIGGLFGLVLGILAALLIRLLDRTVSNADDLAAMGLHVVGVVPALGDARPSKRRRRESRSGNESTRPANLGLEVVRNPRSPFSECFRLIRTNLAFLGAGKSMRTLLVASAGPGDGKTTVAINLCATLAQNQLKVLLIDTDLRRPNVHRSLGIPNGPGVSTILIGESTLEDCVIAIEPGDFDVLTCGPIPPNPSELLDDDAFTRLVETALKKYDRVVLDSPPVGVVADGMILATIADTTMLVARPGLTPRDLLEQAIKQLRTAGVHVAGCIVNAVQTNDLTYGGSAYYYGRSDYHAPDDPERTTAT